MTSERTDRCSTPASSRPGREDPRAELLLRRVLLLVSGAAAAAAVAAGLARLGVLPEWGGSWAPAHGPLFVFGALGTVIGVERTVLLRRRWGYLAPALGSLLVVVVLVGAPGAPVLAVGSTLALVTVNVALTRRRPNAFEWLMLAGSGALCAGAVFWALDVPIHRIVPAWMAFLVLTIVAERVEISRLSPMPIRTVWLAAASATVFAGAAGLAAVGLVGALRVFGIAAIVIGFWQSRFDMARHTLDRPGLSRFAGVGVLLGAGWLIVAGVLFATTTVPPVGARYDAVLHAVFVGYVLSMVFSHAPFILPLVARVSVPFTGWLHVPLVLLHVGVAVRVLGDLAGQFDLRRAGAVSNAAALLLFVLVAVIAQSRRGPTPRPADG